ncbi:MAG: hypothetical protein IJ268_14175 [Proteobacteria bacterium]|nr:hypothetical protein [Pseudomonadota bacterium]
MLIPLIFCIAVLIGIVLTLTRLATVPEDTCFVIEKSGKYETTWEKGIHLRMPGQKVKNKVPKKKITLPMPPQVITTSDNRQVVPHGCIIYEVQDPVKYTYGCAHVEQALAMLCSASLREIIGKLDLRSCKSAPENISEELTAKVNSGSEPWGIRVFVARVDTIID